MHYTLVNLKFTGDFYMAKKLKISIEEANGWHARNFDRKPSDNVISAVQEITNKWSDGKRIGSVLEVGCSDGRNGPRIKKFANYYTGIDPSPDAVSEGLSNGLNLINGWADSFQLEERFDVIILGFFLYLTNPEQWFKIAQNIYSHLKADSYIILNDFYADELRTKVYTHDYSMKMHKYNFCKLFTWHPSIRSIYDKVHTENDQEKSNTDFWYQTSILKATK